MILFSSFNHIWVLLLFVYLGLSSGIIFFSLSSLFERLKNCLLMPKQKKQSNLNDSVQANLIIKEIGNKNIENKKTDNKEIDNSVIDDNEINNDSVNRKENSGKEISNEESNKHKFNRLNKTKKDKKKEKKHKKDTNKKNSKVNKKKKNKVEKRPHKNYLKLVYKKFYFPLFKRISQFFIKRKKPILSVCFTTLKVIILLFVIIASLIINLHFNLGELRVGFVLIFCLAFFTAKSLIKLLANYLVNFYNCFKRKLKKQK